jgi:hypothetical protein
MNKLGMNEVKWLKSLDRASLPRNDVPRIDVTMGVMRAVRTIRYEEDDAVFPLAALAALLAGAAAIAVMLPVWFATENPLAGFADALNLVLQ